MKKSTILLFTSVLLAFTACKKSEDKPDETPTTQSTASFVISGTTYTASDPYLGIFNNNGTINNMLTFTATDGSKMEFNFKGSSPATYPLQSYSNGYYKNAAGKQYNSTSGQLIVTSYTVDGGTYTASGTFSFKAKAIIAPYDSIEVTTGVFNNATN